MENNNSNSAIGWSFWRFFSEALLSCVRSCRLTFRDLRLRRERLGKSYIIDQAGTFRIFRETVSDRAGDEPPVVLVIGFRLKIIRNNPALHWLFQRVCILTTPFWSGFRGFHAKLWMVSPDYKDYLGIYEWHGRENAQRYLGFLMPVLRFFSVSGSVWHRRFEQTKLSDYLASRIIDE